MSRDRPHAMIYQSVTRSRDVLRDTSSRIWLQWVGEPSRCWLHCYSRPQYAATECWNALDRSTIVRDVACASFDVQKDDSYTGREAVAAMDGDLTSADLRRRRAAVNTDDVTDDLAKMPNSRLELHYTVSHYTLVHNLSQMLNDFQHFLPSHSLIYFQQIRI